MSSQLFVFLVVTFIVVSWQEGNEKSQNDSRYEKSYDHPSGLSAFCFIRFQVRCLLSLRKTRCGDYLWRRMLLTRRQSPETFFTTTTIVVAAQCRRGLWMGISRGYGLFSAGQIWKRTDFVLSVHHPVTLEQFQRLFTDFVAPLDANAIKDCRQDGALTSGTANARRSICAGSSTKAHSLLSTQTADCCKPGNLYFFQWKNGKKSLSTAHNDRNQFFADSQLESNLITHPKNV